MPISTSPPKKKENRVSEQQIEAIINKGGEPTKSQPIEADTANKSIKLIMTASEHEAIKQLRDKRQPVGRRKIPISIHDWVIEAIQEKIEREKKKYKL